MKFDLESQQELYQKIANLRQMRKFYEVFSIQQTVSAELKKLEEWIQAFENEHPEQLIDKGE